MDSVWCRDVLDLHATVSARIFQTSSKSGMNCVFKNPQRLADSDTRNQKTANRRLGYGNYYSIVHTTRRVHEQDNFWWRIKLHDTGGYRCDDTADEGRENQWE